MCNEWAAMSINLPSACCRQPIYGLWPIIFTFVFQSCELHSAHQHNAKNKMQRFFSKNQPHPNLALHNILKLMFQIRTFINGVLRKSDDAYDRKV
jgi:hypothetical protein